MSAPLTRARLDLILGLVEDLDDNQEAIATIEAKAANGDFILCDSQSLFFGQKIAITPDALAIVVDVITGELKARVADITAQLAAEGFIDDPETAS